MDQPVPTPTEYRRGGGVNIPEPAFRWRDIAAAILVLSILTLKYLADSGHFIKEEKVLIQFRGEEAASPPRCLYKIDETGTQTPCDEMKIKDSLSASSRGEIFFFLGN